MVMKNSIQSSPDNKISHKFDLKGSMIRRKELPKYASSLSDIELELLLQKLICKDQDFLYLT